MTLAFAGTFCWVAVLRCLCKPRRQYRPCVPFSVTGALFYRVLPDRGPITTMCRVSWWMNATCAIGTLFFRVRASVSSLERHQRSSSSSLLPLGISCQLPKLSICPSGFGRHVPRLKTSALSSWRWVWHHIWSLQGYSDLCLNLALVRSFCHIIFFYFISLMSLTQ